MSDLTVEKDGSILLLTMNRPNRQNAMTLPMFARLADAWEMIDEDLDIRVCILTGAAGNFSSGMDLRSLSGDSEDTDDYDVSKRMEEEGSDFIYRGLLKTKHPRVPLIAAVEGNAIAGGTEILQGTDIRVAGKSAVFGVSEVKWSLYPMGGSAVRLARQIPFTEAADILLTGKHISAEEAKNLGLVGHLVDDGKALDKSMEIAKTICENGPLAVEAVLRTLRETSGMTEKEAFEFEDPIGKEVFASQDAKEGPKAFAQKRAPEFKRS
ncbi:MAG: crotonase/enoyl-CoA hydratase family protein [Acidimicrobiales bacterium]|nr:crotonase/enoyl-CoA hydratase family protein [Acidimicrobiales bacterium]|tara:strand:- start:1189 stop:1989 length:801 start_codon:yes stop_codon:yes gene_type:complete